MAETFELKPDEKKRLGEAIRDFETRTSAEIKVSVLIKAKGDPWDTAVEEFARLGLRKTKLRNAVLICVLVVQRKVVVLGDEGIHAMIPEGTWDRIVETILTEFREGRYFNGLANAIREVGEMLVQHFPHQKDDVNEIPDEVTIREDG